MVAEGAETVFARPAPASPVSLQVTALTPLPRERFGLDVPANTTPFPSARLVYVTGKPIRVRVLKDLAASDPQLGRLLAEPGVAPVVERLEVRGGDFRMTLRLPAGRQAQERPKAIFMVTRWCSSGMKMANQFW